MLVSSFPVNVKEFFSSRSKEFAGWSKFFRLNGVNSYRRVFPREANRKPEKLYAFVKMEANMEMSSLILNIFLSSWLAVSKT